MWLVNGNYRDNAFNRLDIGDLFATFYVGNSNTLRMLNKNFALTVSLNTTDFRKNLS